jgi:uncharacterized protein YheU (UPF0270 family)
MVKILVSQLSREALVGVVEAFVLREGTDYGPVEYTLEEKCARVLEQLHNGEVELNFDPATNSIDIRPMDHS